MVLPRCGSELIVLTFSVFLTLGFRRLMPRQPGCAILASETLGILGLLAAQTYSVLRGWYHVRLFRLSGASLLGVSIVTLIMEQHHSHILCMFAIQSFGFFGFVAARTWLRGPCAWIAAALSIMAFMFGLQPVLTSFVIYHKVTLTSESHVPSFKMMEPIALRGALGVAAYTITVFVVVVAGLAARKLPKATYQFQRWRDKFWRKPVQMVCQDFSTVANGDCSICLCDLADDDGKGILRLPCSHTFHEPCISDWLDKSMQCPVCRSESPDIRECTHFVRQSHLAQAGHAVEARLLQVLGDDSRLVPENGTAAIWLASEDVSQSPYEPLCV